MNGWFFFSHCWKVHKSNHISIGCIYFLPLPSPFFIYSVYLIFLAFFKPMFYAFKFYHFSKRETEPVLLFRLYSRRLDHRIAGLLAYSLSLTVNLDDRSAGRRSCWVWVKQPWPYLCWIRLMLQTGYRDPLPAVACHAGCAPLSLTAVEAKSIKTSAAGDSFYTSYAPFLHTFERFIGHDYVTTFFLETQIHNCRIVRSFCVHKKNK